MPIVSQNKLVVSPDFLILIDPSVFPPHVGDMWPRNSEQEGQEEPEWVKSEREQFTNYRDKNKDGKMDKTEVMDWIIPADYDHSLAEAKHLMFEGDENKVVTPLS